MLYVYSRGLCIHIYTIYIEREAYMLREWGGFQYWRHVLSRFERERESRGNKNSTIERRQRKSDEGIGRRYRIAPYRQIWLDFVFSRSLWQRRIMSWIYIYIYRPPESGSTHPHTRGRNAQSRFPSTPTKFEYEDHSRHSIEQKKNYKVLYFLHVLFFFLPYCPFSLTDGRKWS